MSYRRETLPDWAKDMVALYESDAASQFILHGNIHDRFLLGTSDGTSSGGLIDFLKEVLMPQFDVILLYDLGNGLRVDRGGEKFKEWPPIQMNAELPRMNRGKIAVGAMVESAHLVAPAVPGVLNYDLNALALLFREWASSEFFRGQAVVSCLLTENLNDLHPIVVNNPRVAKIKIPFPSTKDLEVAIRLAREKFTLALGPFN